MDITTIETFNELIEDSYLTVVHFWAEWAEQCDAMDVVLHELSLQKMPKVRLCRVEAEKISQISIDNKITAVPTVLFFRSGKLVDRVDGANAALITKKTLALASIDEDDDDDEVKTSVINLQNRLKQLTTSSPCVLFMKGDKNVPKCGFSRQMLEILNAKNVAYSTFDILSDEIIRQELKKYSDWPTYPQLYVNGQFIGGLDIVKGMVSSGEFDEVVTKVTAVVKDETPVKPVMVESLDARLNKLINRSTLMVFMKGSRNAPQCGFSRQIIEILEDEKLAYDTFDILEDDDVRQGLKKYSDWPTYPQVYAKGELVGGLDIIKELKKTGDLMSTLKS